MLSLGGSYWFEGPPLANANGRPFRCVLITRKVLHSTLGGCGKETRVTIGYPLEYCRFSIIVRGFVVFSISALRLFLDQEQSETGFQLFQRAPNIPVKAVPKGVSLWNQFSSWWKMNSLTKSHLSSKRRSSIKSSFSSGLQCHLLMLSIWHSTLMSSASKYWKPFFSVMPSPEVSSVFDSTMTASSSSDYSLLASPLPAYSWNNIMEGKETTLLRCWGSAWWEERQLCSDDELLKSNNGWLVKGNKMMLRCLISSREIRWSSRLLRSIAEGPLKKDSDWPVNRNVGTVWWANRYNKSVQKLVPHT